MTTTTKIKQIRKQVVPDTLISDEIITSIVDMVTGKLEDVYNPSQKEIVTILMNTRLTYQTVARVVKVFLPDANPTANSVRSLANHIKMQDKLMANFLDELREEINNYG